MKNAVTYKDLSLSLGEVISMEELEIVQKPNRHGQMRLSATLYSDNEDTVFYEMPETVSVFCREDGTEKILFQGVIADSSMKRLGNHMELTLKAYDSTWLLDTKKKTRSFQNTSRTNHSVIAEVMREYPECICMKNIPEEALGRIWFQYEETDWEFLCRFLSHYGDSLYADATYHTARFQAGLSIEDIDTDWESLPYRVGKDLERYDALSQNGYPELMLQQFVQYSVDSCELYTLGSRLRYKGAQWYIGSLKRQLKDGLLVNSYELRQKEAMLVVPQYNRRITGISVDGKTAQINRDKVRVTINGDMTSEQGTYWFPFSTVAASADGSGWYSMPEEGDSIRVYFPTCDEKEAYVITKHDSHMPASASGGNSGADSSFGSGKNSGLGGSSGGGGNSSSGSNTGGGNSGSGGSFGSSSFSGGGGSGVALAAAGTAGLAAGAAGAAAAAQAAGKKEDPMDDPGKRNIFTKDGCVVQMVPEGVILSAGKASISLLKSGEVTFEAPNGLYLNAGKKLDLNGQTVTMEATRQIELKNAKGADVKIMKPQIRINAKEIFEN